MQVQRYRVSLWVYGSRFAAPYYERKETMSGSFEGAVRGLMRQTNLPLVHRAKVVAVRTGSCQWLENISLHVEKVSV